MSLRTISHTPNEVKCPVCGYECVHPVALKVEPVSDDTVVYINHDGLHTVPSRAAERIRGIQITTTFLCEEAYQWDEVCAFHKGINTQTIERGPDWSDFECTPTTIWRD
jgi:hypothetical protein